MTFIELIQSFSIQFKGNYSSYVDLSLNQPLQDSLLKAVNFEIIKEMSGKNNQAETLQYTMDVKAMESQCRFPSRIDTDVLNDRGSEKA